MHCNVGVMYRDLYLQSYNHAIMALHYDTWLQWWMDMWYSNLISLRRTTHGYSGGWTCGTAISSPCGEWHMTTVVDGHVLQQSHLPVENDTWLQWWMDMWYSNLISLRRTRITSMQWIAQTHRLCSIYLSHSTEVNILGFNPRTFSSQGERANHYTSETYIMY